MRTLLYFVFTCLLCNATALAEPQKIFLSAEEKICAESLRFWCGETVELSVFSHLELAEQPNAFLLNYSTATPVKLEDVSYSATKLKEGLYLHSLTFTAPELRLQQKILLKFGTHGFNLTLDIYPTWLREQVAAKAAAYDIQIAPRHAGASRFIKALDMPESDQKNRPLFRIVHSEHEILIRQSARKFIWKTNCDALDADNPTHVLRFEALLKTLNEK